MHKETEISKNSLISKFKFPILYTLGDSEGKFNYLQKISSSKSQYLKVHHYFICRFIFVFGL